MKHPRAVKLHPHAAGLVAAIRYIGSVPNVNEVLTGYDRGMLVGMRMALGDERYKVMWPKEGEAVLAAIRAAEAQRAK